MTREELGRLLYEKSEHLDPGPEPEGKPSIDEPDWPYLTESEREFWRCMADEAAFLLGVGDWE
jgi:hypothetical protein